MKRTFREKLKEFLGKRNTVVALAAAIGFFGMLFLGKAGFFLAAPVAVLIAVRLVFEYVSKTSTELTMLFVAAVAGGILFFTFIRSYKNTKDDLNGVQPTTERQQQKQLRAEEDVAALEETEQLFADIRFGEKSLLFATSAGTIYQVIKADGRLYFHKTGGYLTGIDEQLLIKNFDDVASQLDGKDYFIELPALAVKITLKNNFNQPYMSFGTVKITTADGKKQKLQHF